MKFCATIVLACSALVVSCSSRLPLDPVQKPGSSAPGVSQRRAAWTNSGDGNLEAGSSRGGDAVSMGPNLLVNGDFEQGNVGFSTGYFYSPGDLFPPQTYTVDTKPFNSHPGFTMCGDHTTGAGNLMVINGSTAPGVTVWSQQVSVSPHQTYVLAGWVESVFPESPAHLQFSINGSPVGEFQVSSDTCHWQPFNMTWFSGSATTATVEIIDQNLDFSGNDFALDDLVMIQDVAPPAIVISADPSSLWPPNGKLVPVKLSGSIVDDGSGVSTSGATYTVTDEDGHVLNSGQVVLGSGGDFTFTVLLQASRSGKDADGRQYFITIYATDQAGNSGSSSTIVTVAHDQRMRNPSAAPGRTWAE